MIGKELWEHFQIDMNIMHTLKIWLNKFSSAIGPFLYQNCDQKQSSKQESYLEPSQILNTVISRLFFSSLSFTSRSPLTERRYIHSACHIIIITIITAFISYSLSPGVLIWPRTIPARRVAPGKRRCTDSSSSRVTQGRFRWQSTFIFLIIKHVYHHLDHVGLLSKQLKLDE